MSRKAENRKPTTEPAAEPRHRRIAEFYRKHLDAIAQIFVRAGEVKTVASREVIFALPHLKGFRPARFDSWRENAEWQSALEAARSNAAAHRSMPPETRGAKLLHFAQDALKEIETAYESAKSEKSEAAEKEKKELEARIIKLHDALRAEERHQDSLKTSARMRDFAEFAERLRFALRGLPDEFEQRLIEIQRDPAKLMAETKIE